MRTVSAWLMLAAELLRLAAAGMFDWFRQRRDLVFEPVVIVRRPTALRRGRRMGGGGRGRRGELRSPWERAPLDRAPWDGIERRKTPRHPGRHTVPMQVTDYNAGPDPTLTTESRTMTIKVGESVPDATLFEYRETEGEGCSIGPNAFKVADLLKGKKVVIFGLPGAFTPTCSAQHVPGYVKHVDALRGKGIDEIWCVSVNDAFVMGAWARDQQSAGKVRMMADGSAEFSRKIGLELDLTARGMGIRSQRYSMLVDNGVVKALNIEAPGKFEVSGAEKMLEQA